MMIKHKYNDLFCLNDGKAAFYFSVGILSDHSHWHSLSLSHSRKIFTEVTSIIVVLFLESNTTLNLFEKNHYYMFDSIKIFCVQIRTF